MFKTIFFSGFLLVALAGCAAFASPTETPTPTETTTPTVTFAPTDAATQTPFFVVVTATPSATNEPTAAPASSGNDISFATRTSCTPNPAWTTRYTVRRGDTVGRIASSTGTTVSNIAEGNCLANANNIFVGQVLRVPRTPSFIVTPETTKEVTEEATEAVTEEATEAVTEEATEAVTEEATEAVTEEA